MLNITIQTSRAEEEKTNAERSSHLKLGILASPSKVNKLDTTG